MNVTVQGRLVALDTEGEFVSGTLLQVDGGRANTVSFWGKADEEGSASFLDVDPESMPEVIVWGSCYAKQGKDGRPGTLQFKATHVRSVEESTSRRAKRAAANAEAA